MTIRTLAKNKIEKTRAELLSKASTAVKEVPCWQGITGIFGKLMVVLKNKTHDQK